MGRRRARWAWARRNGGSARGAPGGEKDRVGGGERGRVRQSAQRIEASGRLREGGAPGFRRSETEGCWTVQMGSQGILECIDGSDRT